MLSDFNFYIDKVSVAIQANHYDSAMAGSVAGRANIPKPDGVLVY